MTNVNFDLGSMSEIVMELGGNNFRVMKLGNQGHVEDFSAPSSAFVSVGTKTGTGVLVIGQDLVNLADLLKQIEETDINVYYQSELLPAHMYPKLREHPNLAGHYDGAKQKQKMNSRLSAGQPWPQPIAS